jgi:hypothetical protein
MGASRLTISPISTALSRSADRCRQGLGPAAGHLGLAGVVNGISAAHQRWLAAGGLGVLVGDGALPHPGTEQIVEAYYAYRPVGWGSLTWIISISPIPATTAIAARPTCLPCVSTLVSEKGLDHDFHSPAQLLADAAPDAAQSRGCDCLRHSLGLAVLVFRTAEGVVAPLSSSSRTGHARSGASALLRAAHRAADVCRAAGFHRVHAGRGHAGGAQPAAGQLIVPALDILQSVPILGFLTFTVTFFMNLFPGNVLGVELASVFAIFTSQAWNMAFSFYQSLRSLPADLEEVCQGFALSPCAGSCGWTCPMPRPRWCGMR